jgi:hypothetical protein
LGVRNDQLRRSARKRHIPGDHLICRDTERIKIAATINALGRSLLGRDILRRAHKDAGARQAFAAGVAALGCLRDAKIGQQHPPIDIDHDVLGLDITVNCALTMRVIERRRNRADNRDRVTKPQRAALLNDRVQRVAAHIFHRNIVQAILLTNIVNCYDIRVAQIRGGYRLALKPLREFRIDRQLREQDFDRNSSLELRIQGTINARHSTAPDLLLDREATELLADQVCQRGLPKSCQASGVRSQKEQ